jgi:ribA/ribD-fused uncharacterized protein
MNDNTFNCVEQSYLYDMLSHYGLKDAAEKILLEPDPGKQKGIASFAMKSIHPDPSWLSQQTDVMERALLAKFNHNTNPVNYEKLIKTTEQFVECNKHDTFWGIGLSIYDKSKMKKANWRGENRLGNLLCAVRERLRSSVPGDG